MASTHYVLASYRVPWFGALSPLWLLLKQNKGLLLWFPLRKHKIRKIQQLMMIMVTCEGFLGASHCSRYFKIFLSPFIIVGNLWPLCLDKETKAQTKWFAHDHQWVSGRVGIPGYAVCATVHTPDHATSMAHGVSDTRRESSDECLLQNRLAGDSFQYKWILHPSRYCCKRRTLLVPLSAM